MLFEKITENVKDAMKTKNSVKLSCLRLITSEIKNQTVNAGKPITDEICLKVIQKSVKQHNDSIEQFSKAGRKDLADVEKAELAYLEAYLPKMLSPDETRACIEKIFESGVEPVKKNMGVIMKTLRENKSIDGAVAAKILNQILV